MGKVHKAILRILKKGVDMDIDEYFVLIEEKKFGLQIVFEVCDGTQDQLRTH